MQKLQPLKFTSRTDVFSFLAEGYGRTAELTQALKTEFALEEVPVYVRFYISERLDLRMISLDIPADQMQREIWLSQVMYLDAVRASVASLDAKVFPWASALVRHLEAAVAVRCEKLLPLRDLWLHGRQKEECEKQFGLDIRPWKLIPYGVETLETSVPSVRVMVAWLSDKLAHRDEVALRRLVVQDELWRESYRRVLREVCGIRIELDFSGDLRLRHLSHRFVQQALPHLGREVCVVAEQTLEGKLRWSWPGREPMDFPQVAGKVTLGDEVTGDLVWNIDCFEVDAVYCAHQARCKAAELVAHAKNEPEVAALIVQELRASYWFEAVKRVAQAPLLGERADVDDVLLVEKALETRLYLYHLALVWPSEDLEEQLRRVDEAYAIVGPQAVEALDEEVFFRVLFEDSGRLPENKRAWWTERYCAYVNRIASLDTMSPCLA